MSKEENNKENQEELNQNSVQEEAKASTAPIEDFDWDKYEKDAIEYDDSERNELEKLYSETLSTLDEKEIVTGTVVKISDRDVVLNVGFKSDGLVPLSEFKDRPDLKAGDEVQVLVETPEDSEGQILLSYKKARAEKAWETIVDAHENDKILKGHITDRTKGGMVVDLMGMDAFLPGSQIDIRPIKDYDAYVGKTLDLKVVKLNPSFRNIVVSHKAIIESDLEQQKTEILSKIEKGQVLEGTVKNLTSFGVFVDLGGVDGLVHITDVSWGRIKHPEEILELGEKINVVVLEYDQEKKRISLGMKQLTPHPWETLPEDVQEGSEVNGKIVNIEDYGAFLEIHPNVEGLIHVSEMSWSQHLKAPEEYVKLGQEVKAKVLSIDREDRKLSLGLKQLTKDPWSDIEVKYEKGSSHTAKVRSMTNFGLFVELEEGVDGLVHISDLSWIKKISHPSEFTKVGDDLEVVVLEIDKENRRLSLGHKQLEDDPWNTFETIFIPESQHDGEIARVEPNGAIVRLPYGIEAFAPNKHLMKKDKSKVEAGETLPFVVREFDKDNRKVIVSHTDLWKEEERAQKRKDSESTQKSMKQVNSSSEKNTMGSEVNVLQQIKDKMKSEELEKQKEAIAKLEKKNEEGNAENNDNKEEGKEDK